MARPPLVEPPAPILGAHERRLGAKLAELLELVVDVGAGAEVHRPHKVVKAVLGEVAGPVALKQGHVAEASGTHGVADGRHVSLVLAVGAVLVLHLHHYYGAAVLYRQRRELLANLVHEAAHALHEVWVLLAQPYVLLLQQPPRQAAHLPLCAHVRAGAHYDVHPVLLRQAAELGYVVLPGEVEFALALLVDVPEHVHADGVHAQRTTHLDAVLPVWAGYARVMQLGCLHHERLSVEQECLVAGSERAALGRAGNGRHNRQQRGQGHRCKFSL